MNYEEKYRELAEAVRRWLAIDDKLAQYGWGTTVCVGNEARKIDDAWDEAKNSLWALVGRENK